MKLKRQKNNKKKGKLFWITGLSGSGKTSIAERIKNRVAKKYGKTLTISGDELRQIFNYDKFSRNKRIQYAYNYSKFCKLITDQNINVIISTVSLFHKVRSWNRSNISNYIEIYIKADLDTIIKKKKKFFYEGNHKNIIGKNIKAELPKKPDIIIENNFKKSVKKLSKELENKIFSNKQF